MREVETDPLEELKTNLAHLGLVIDESGALVVEKLKAKRIETENLQVKAEDVAQTGITLYDRSSGEPYCLYIENGEMKNMAGECQGISRDSSAEPALERSEGPQNDSQGEIPQQVEESKEPVIKETTGEENLLLNLDATQ